MFQVILGLFVLLFLYSYNSSETEVNAVFHKFEPSALLLLDTLRLGKN